MRLLPLVALVMIASACMSVSGPVGSTASPVPPATQTATPTPTPPPAATASPAPPTPQATPEPTPSPAEPTPDPNLTPDPHATPQPTAIDVLPYLTSEVTVVNLAATSLAVTVTLVDSESTDEYEIGTFDVQPEQVTSQLVIPARLRLEFALGGSELATCTIDVADAEQLQFAAIETGVVLTTNGAEPADPAEMVVATSSRCQAGAT